MTDAALDRLIKWAIAAYREGETRVFVATVLELSVDR